MSDFVPQPSTQSPLIVGLCGSVNPNSLTKRALILSLEAVRRAGAQVELVDLTQLRLPFGGSRFDHQEFPDVTRLNTLLRSAHGQIWATPEYHGSFSGVLKNALDLGGFDEYSGKAVALLGVAGGQIGAIQALSHLRTIARQLHCWCLPEQVSIARISGAFDETGQFKDENLAASVDKMARQLVRWARVFEAERGN